MARHTASETDSLLSSAPPSYRTYNEYQRSLQQPRVRNNRLREYYMDDEGDSGSKRAFLYGILGFLTALIVLTFVLQLTTILNKSSCPVDPLSPSERERVRREWQLERDTYQEERIKRDIMREQWEREDRLRAQQNQQWEVDRQRHAKEVKGWLDERARMLGRLWNEPQAGGHCIAYNTREYTAELDAFAACKTAPIMIHDRNITSAACTQYNRVCIYVLSILQ